MLGKRDMVRGECFGDGFREVDMKSRVLADELYHFIMAQIMVSCLS